MPPDDTQNQQNAGVTMPGAAVPPVDTTPQMPAAGVPDVTPTPAPVADPTVNPPSATPPVGEQPVAGVPGETGQGGQMPPTMPPAAV